MTTFKQLKESLYWNIGYNKSVGMNTMHAILDAVIIEIVAIYYIIIEKTICHKYGHNLVEEGYANPDSGYIEMTCKRCHKEWHQTLY